MFLGENWFNSESVFQTNGQLLREVEEFWLIDERINPHTYVLESPEVKDPSMGQAETIRQIFDYSVSKR